MWGGSEMFVNMLILRFGVNGLGSFMLWGKVFSIKLRIWI